MVEGYPISSPAGLQKLRSIMGICPQFDMLWPKLTAREHLEICLAIKVVYQVSEKYPSMNKPSPGRWPVVIAKSCLME